MARGKIAFQLAEEALVSFLAMAVVVRLQENTICEENMRIYLVLQYAIHEITHSLEILVHLAEAHGEAQ